MDEITAEHIIANVTAESGDWKPNVSDNP